MAGVVQSPGRPRGDERSEADGSAFDPGFLLPSCRELAGRSERVVHADDPASALAQRPRHSYCVWIR